MPTFSAKGERLDPGASFLSNGPMKILGHLDVRMKPMNSDQAWVLRYDVFDTPPATRWLELYLQDLHLEKRPWFGGMFYGPLFAKDQGPRLHHELNELLQELDTKINKKIFSHHQKEVHDQQNLSLLHDLKVQWTDCQTPGTYGPWAALLDRLNYIIHRLESSEGKKAGQGAINIVPFPPTRIPLEREFLKFFSLQRYFGGLYLDYATNGVPFIDAYRYGSADRPVAQSFLSSGVYLNFWRDDVFEITPQFQKWLAGNFQETFQNPALALGVIPLGQLANSVGREELLALLSQVESVISISFVSNKSTVDTKAAVSSAASRPDPQEILAL